MTSDSSRLVGERLERRHALAKQRIVEERAFHQGGVEKGVHLDDLAIAEAEDLEPAVR